MPQSFGKSALKVLLGLVFIISAVLKVFDMDKFEIYVYSYHFFSLNLSFIVARLAVILELVLGFCLVANVLHKLMWWGSMVMLMGYTLLLIYALALGRTDSCHCFGDFLQLDPKQSLVKNSVLMLLFLLIYKMESWKTPFRWLILCLAVMVSMVSVFVVSPPDNLTSNFAPEHNLQKEAFNEMLDGISLDNMDLREGKQIVCFFSTSCGYCQLAARKLSLMQQFYGFPPEHITYLFMGNEEGIIEFYELSESLQYRNMLYPNVVRFLKAVNGNLPTIVFMEDGNVIYEYGFRNMDEEEIRAFMAF